MHFNVLLIAQCVLDLIICCVVREYAKCDEWCGLQMPYLLVSRALFCCTKPHCAE